MSTTLTTITKKTKRSKSEARRAYWATLTPEERSARLRKVATIKARNMTPEQRRAHAMVMVAGRKKK